MASCYRARCLVDAEDLDPEKFLAKLLPVESDHGDPKEVPTGLCYADGTAIVRVVYPTPIGFIRFGNKRD